MIVDSGSASIGLDATLKEPITNRDASDYIIDNYNMLVTIIRGLGINQEKSQDLLHDVYISIIDSENNNEPFDYNYFRGDTLSDNKNKPLAVGQFVIGRIKLYAKNAKYRSDAIESTSSSREEFHTTSEVEKDFNGRVILDKNGKPKVTRTTERIKVQSPITTYAASFETGGDPKNDEFQIAYSTAHIADSTEDTVEILSLRDQIEYCIDICELHNIKIVNLFKNIELLSSMISDLTKRRKTYEGVFRKLRELAEYHDELEESLVSILMYSSKNRNAFEVVMSSY